LRRDRCPQLAKADKRPLTGEPVLTHLRHAQLRISALQTAPSRVSCFDGLVER
jgi:hypothetical protein